MQIKNKNKPKNKEKDCASMENFIQLDWICVKIEKKNRIPGRSRKQIHKTRVNKYNSSSVCRTEYF